MMSRLIKILGCVLTLLFAVPSFALSSVASTSSRQACAGVSTSSAATSQASISALTCKVTVVNDWNSGYQVAVTVTNTGTIKIDNWRVFLTIPGGQVYSSGWDAIVTQISPTQIELRKPDWQGPLLPGQSVVVGAQFKKPIGSTGVVSCTTQIAPPPNTAPKGEFIAEITNDTVHVKTINATDAEGDKLTHSFDFGDGTVINAADVWHSYSVPGTYTITHTISDGALTRVNTNVINVTSPGANRAPVAIFSYNTSALQVSLNASASADREGAVLTYTWEGLTTPSTSMRTGTSLPQGGGYVTLTVFDGELGNTVQYRIFTTSCLSSDPQPRLVINNSTHGNSVAFDASQSEIVDSFTWDFGDGSTDTGMFANHTYAAPGTYTVTLRGTAQMMSATKTQQIVITNTTPTNLLPVAELSCTEHTLVADDFVNGVASYRYLVRCDASASYDPEGKPLTYNLNWGDGNSNGSTTGLLSHMYATGGEFNLTLHVSDGEKQTEKTLLWIATAPTTSNRVPVACFDIASGTDLNVNASCSSDADGDSLVYSWGFGDGTNATGVTAIHTYSAPGSYTVKLTVSDGKATNISSKTFVVNPTQKPTRCEFKITNAWSTGYQGALRIYNQSTSPVSNWAAVVKFPNGIQINNSWNGTVIGTNPYQVTPAAWNATLQPGTFAQVGFQVWDGTPNHQVPVISGSSCE